ncbi:class A beta-lactamase-related serine hydrolase [Chryseobacterium joostei]|uniref:Class A beta-lactamase-related serine hydrolase n=1 Tax=Chryseobacterium joostei TaxID=112234 RepID=A0A1N7I1N0_9FLAO|nr:serine hydrolase domain-containing protein [Chryseobacterium joostei]AZA99468.1 class A beta-lactamase-related serine hydrolase [Chryseobacterium joostei]SIS30980.1 CubicO group peptidase, beta-lactamase class C family [Chryseobacterium joostei]SIS47405.1 CubicO group peptidase, beta-lactamase class C family [Chryseobacterium joostei]
MKSTFYLLILMVLVSSCQTSKKVFAEKRDYSFLTDSLKVEEQLEKYKLPGFSLVVFENYKIIYSSQVGVKSMNSKEKLDVNTAFSTASITKPITALLCHILEEKGLINLDEPIDKYLKRWHLPKSKFTESNSPTWKQFFNHTSGTNQGGFSDYYEGDVIPTIKQSLLGQIPRYDKEIEFLFTPGTNFEYSGGGYVIVQMALEDTLNKSIAELAQEHLFLPLGLTNTTMIQPNEKGFPTNVASVHDKDGKVIKTGLPITPQIGASGVWSTPTDLAKLSIEIQNALRNKNNKVISHQVAKKVTEVTALKNAVGGWGYGWQKSVAYNNYDWFTCNGSNTGVGGSIFATMEDGNGFVILANGEKPNRIPVMNEARIKLLTLMNWNKKISNEDIQELPLSLKKQLIGTYNDFLYGQGAETKIIEKNNRLYVESLFLGYFKGKNENELQYLKNGTFKIVDYPNVLKFDFSNGKVNSVILTRDSMKTEVQITKK